jgi:hypothetical protein
LNILNIYIYIYIYIFVYREIEGEEIFTEKRGISGQRTSCQNGGS